MSAAPPLRSLPPGRLTPGTFASGTAAAASSLLNRKGEAHRGSLVEEPTPAPDDRRLPPEVRRLVGCRAPFGPYPRSIAPNSFGKEFEYEAQTRPVRERDSGTTLAPRAALGTLGGSGCRAGECQCP